MGMTCTGCPSFVGFIRISLRLATLSSSGSAMVSYQCENLPLRLQKTPVRCWNRQASWNLALRIRLPSPHPL